MLRTQVTDRKSVQDPSESLLFKSLESVSIQYFFFKYIIYTFINQGNSKLIKNGRKDVYKIPNIFYFV